MTSTFSDNDENEDDANDDAQTGGMFTEEAVLLLLNSDTEDEDLNDFKFGGIRSSSSDNGK